MTRTRAVSDPTARLRSSRANTESRLSTYPLAQWLSQAIDATAPDAPPTEAGAVELIATKGEDFQVSRTVFVQDLHRLARQASYRAYVTNEPFGYVVRTSTRDLPPTEVAFAFFRVAIAEASLPKTTRGQIAGERQRLAYVATQAATGMPAEILAAWELERTYGWFCREHADGEPPHVRGYGGACPGCAGTTAEILPEEPTAAFIAAYRDQHPAPV